MLADKGITTENINPVDFDQPVGGRAPYFLVAPRVASDSQDKR